MKTIVIFYYPDFIKICSDVGWVMHTLQLFMFITCVYCNYVYDRVIVIHITVPFLPFIVLQIK